MKTKSFAGALVILSITVFAVLNSPFLPQGEPNAGLNRNQITVMEVKNSQTVDNNVTEADQDSGKDQNHSVQSEVDKDWKLSTAVEFRFETCNANDTIHLALGTKLDEHTLLTHNHHGNYTEICMLDPGDTQVARNIAIKTTSQPMGHGDQYGDQTRLVYMTENVADSFAPIVSQQVINQLAAGEFVEVVYWDDAFQRLAIAELQIKAFLGNSVMVLDDPGDIINIGDSGGGVFYQDALIGNTWKYMEIQDQQGNLIEKEVHVQIIPPELAQALRNWQQTTENMGNSPQPSDQDQVGCTSADANSGC